MEDVFVKIIWKPLSLGHQVELSAEIIREQREDETNL